MTGPLPLADRVALVTGGARRLGLACAYGLRVRAHCSMR